MATTGALEKNKTLQRRPRMKEDLYRLIPEEGKHLAESRDTEGAYRGVYLDDVTNKPSGAGEFIKVDPDELEDTDNDSISDNKESSDAAGIAALITLGIGIGVGIAKAYPSVKEWVKETALPSVKGFWNKLFGKEESPISAKSEVRLSESTTDETAISIDVAFNEYRENMTSEDAQRELLEAFILYLVSMKKVHRVANANVVDSEGEITEGKMYIEALSNKGMIESINEILLHNPMILDQKQEAVLSDILGYNVTNQKDYIPITAEALSTRLFPE